MNGGSSNTEMESRNGEISRGHCMNCGAELKGTFCHECGQKVSSTSHGIKDFLLEYLNNAYMWDPQIFITLWQLASRPGYLSKRFLSGKVISHSHPLKLNMFLLFVFITFFVLFHEADNLNRSFYNITRDERVFAVLQAQFLFENEEYAEKMKACPRDTVRMRAPLMLVQDYPEMVAVLEIEEDNKGESVDKWIGIIPQVLIEDKILLCDESGYYFFNQEAESDGDRFGMNVFDNVVSTMLDIVTSYIPLIILFTAPLLAISVRFVQRGHKRPFLHHLIFSLHYTAFVELLVLVIYIAYLIVSPPTSVMKWGLVSASVFYLILAFREVYGVKSWGQSVVKAVFTNVIYQLICVLVLFVILILACIVVAGKYEQI